MEVNKYQIIARFYEQCGPGFWDPFHSIFKKNIDISKKYHMVDLGCGTGDAIKYLGEYLNGYLGIDHSSDMLKISKSRYPNFNFIKADICDYQSLDGIKYDLALSAYDTINHLPSRRLWQNFLKNTSNLLKDNGLFVFDMCTINDHRNNWNNYVDLIENDDYIWLRKGQYDLGTSTANIHNYFFISANSDKLFTKEYDLVQHISFEIEEVIQMLLENGFSEINVFDLHSSMEVDNNTSVATFFCKKK